MGNCAASPPKKMSMASTAKVIHVDGRLQELKQPIKAGQLISKHPNCFLCCSESMQLGSVAPQMEDEEELQLGQIYFLMPLSLSLLPLSLPDLCSLAIKASSALSSSSSSPFPPTLRSYRSGCKIPLPSSHAFGLDRRYQSIKL